MNVMRTPLAMLGAAVLLATAPAGWAAGTGYLFVSSEKDHAISVLDGRATSW